MESRGWGAALVLFALLNTNPGQAAMGKESLLPDDKERIVQLDLAEIRPGPNKVRLPAPIEDSYKIQLINRAPNAEYEVSIEVKGDPKAEKTTFRVNPADLRSITMPASISVIQTLNCGTLKRYPLGRLCTRDTSGVSKCEEDEEKVSVEVHHVLEALEHCRDLKPGVLNSLRIATGDLSSVQPGGKPEEDWEREVTVTRLKDEEKDVQATSQPWRALISTCAPESQLEAYLRANHPAEELVVLAFDHREQSWSGRRWYPQNRQLVLLDDAEFENSFANKPQLSLKKDEHLMVFATNTNPLLFSTTSTAATETDIEDLKALQSFTASLGGFLSAAIATRVPDIRVSQGEIEETADFQPAFTPHALRVIIGETGDESRPMDEDLQKPAREILELLQPHVTALDQRLGALRVSGDNLDRELRSINEQNAAIKTYLQLVESDSPDGIQAPDLAQLPQVLSELETIFRDIVTQRNALEKHKPVCTGLLSSLQEAARLARMPLPEKPLEAKLASDRYQDLVDNLVCRLMTHLPFDEAMAQKKKCEEENKNACGEDGRDLAARILLFGEQLERLRPGSASPEQEAVLRPLEKGVAIYTAQVEQRSAMLKASNEVLVKRGDIAKTAGNIQILSERQARHSRGSKSCGLRSGVLQVARVEGKEANLRWSKVRNEGFKLAVDSGYRDAIALSRPAEATASYELALRRKWDLDVDVAAIYTEVSDPTFAAVDLDPVSSTNNNTIVRTDEKSRAGELAMFVGLMFGRSKVGGILAGPQLGVGLSVDHPAIFLGGSVGYGIVKLGVGWNWQQIKRLRRDQREGMEVTPDNPLSTRNTFDDGFYASLSITLDELPFFQPASAK